MLIPLFSILSGFLVAWLFGPESLRLRGGRSTGKGSGKEEEKEVDGGKSVALEEVVASKPSQSGKVLEEQADEADVNEKAEEEEKEEKKEEEEEEENEVQVEGIKRSISSIDSIRYPAPMPSIPQGVASRTFIVVLIGFFAVVGGKALDFTGAGAISVIIMGLILSRSWIPQGRLPLLPCCKRSPVLAHDSSEGKTSQ